MKSNFPYSRLFSQNAYKFNQACNVKGLDIHGLMKKSPQNMSAATLKSLMTYLFSYIII